MNDTHDAAPGDRVAKTVQETIGRLSLGDILEAQFIPAHRTVRLRFLGTGESFDYPLESRLIGQIDKHLEGFARHRRFTGAGNA